MWAISGNLLPAGRHLQAMSDNEPSRGTRDKEARFPVRYREDKPEDLARARAEVAAWRARNPQGTAEQLLADSRTEARLTSRLCRSTEVPPRCRSSQTSIVMPG